MLLPSSLPHDPGNLLRPIRRRARCGGKMREPSANGASYNSLGQRPRTTARHLSPALKGRNNPAIFGAIWVFNPGGWIALSGLISFMAPIPGRCPGLVWRAPLGPEETQLAASRATAVSLLGALATELTQQT